jgi:transposase
MTVAAEVEAEIARLFHAEHWKVGTIVAQLGVHEDVVRRVLGLLRPPAERAPRPPLLVAPFTDFINQTLAKYPRLRSTRLLDMLKERGFRGSERTLRRFVMMVRPAPKREAFLRLDPLIGEQAQIDWAHVGQIPVPGGGSRSLWLFVMVLAWSRAMWGEFCFDTTVHSLLRSLVRASTYFGGATRQWHFDNPKIVVLERHGDTARFHPLLLDLGSAMHVQLQLCAPYRGNEKGRVERKIRFLRERFLAGRDIYDIQQGNRELLGSSTPSPTSSDIPTSRSARSPTAWQRKSSASYRCPALCPPPISSSPRSSTRPRSPASIPTSIRSLPTTWSARLPSSPTIFQSAFSMAPTSSPTILARGVTGKRSSTPIIVPRSCDASAAPLRPLVGIDSAPPRRTSTSSSSAGSRRAATSAAWWRRPAACSTCTAQAYSRRPSQKPSRAAPTIPAKWACCARSIGAPQNIPSLSTSPSATAQSAEPPAQLRLEPRLASPREGCGCS